MEILQNFLSTYGWPRLYGSSRNSVAMPMKGLGSSFLRDRLAGILWQVESARNGCWAARKPSEASGRSKIHGPNEAYQDNAGPYRTARDFLGTPRTPHTTRLA